MNERIKELIIEMGIIPEDEHYEVAEAVIRKCIDLLPEDCPHPDGRHMSWVLLNYFGVKP